VSAAFLLDEGAKRALADKILDASVNVGFFYLKSHGIPEAAFQRMVDAGKAFFAQPTAKKMEYDVHKSTNYKGYTAMLAENTDVTGNGDLHEGFDIGYEPRDGAPDQASDSAMDGANVWPADVPGFRDAFLDYYDAALRLGQHLFPIFALALGLPERWFDDKVRHPARHAREC